MTRKSNKCAKSLHGEKSIEFRQEQKREEKKEREDEKKNKLPPNQQMVANARSKNELK